MGLFDILFGNNDEEKDQAFGLFSYLEEEQKDLVKRNTYDETSFEEEDLEDDDYYFEDDE